MDGGYPYPKEVYKEKSYRVVHSPEEHETARKQGWADDPVEGVTYRAHTASAPAVPKPARLGGKLEAHKEAS